MHLRARARTTAGLTALAALGGILTASPAAAHGTICGVGSYAPTRLYTTAIYGEGRVTCGVTAHNDDVEMIVEIWKNISWAPDTLVARSNPKRGGGPGQTLRHSVVGACRGQGDYFVITRYRAIGYHGYSITRTARSYDNELC